MGPRVAETGTLTAVALAIIAVLAVLTVIGILWGARLKRQRAEAEQIEEQRVASEGGDPDARDRPLRDDDATDVPAAKASSPQAAPSAPDAAPSPPEPAPSPADAAPSPRTVEPEPAPAPTPAPTLADEPIAAAAPLDASPAAEAASPPSEPVVEAGPPPADGPVTQLKGLGPKVAARLAEHGIVTVGDLAALDAQQAEALDARLGPFTGRMNRDRWIEQARFLAAGDRAGFEAVFGKL